MLVATALVLLMTPALAFFYGGLVRSKNALNTMMMSFVSLGFVGVLWAVVGYSLAFGTGDNWIGDLSRLFLRGVGLEAQGTIPHVLFMAYQGTFAIITAALISGAIVERMRFSAYVAVHLALGARRLQPGRALGVGRRLAGQVGRARLRRRHRRPRQRRRRGAGGRDRASASGRTIRPSSLLPHNVPFTLLGAGLLWFGWFGFNAGSALAASPIAALAFVDDDAGAGGARWSSGRSSTCMRSGKPTAVGAATAIVVGLVAITPAAGFISPMSAIALGAIAAVPSYLGADGARQDVARRLARRRRRARRRRHRRRAADRRLRAEEPQRRRGRCCSSAIPASSASRRSRSLAAIVYSGVMSFILLKLIGLVIPLRASESAESEGLDVSQHGEEAYLHEG